MSDLVNNLEFRRISDQHDKKLKVLIETLKEKGIGDFENVLKLVTSTPQSKADKTLKKLNSLQQWFVRLILQVGPGAPLAALTWETGLLDMKLRIYKEKLLMIMHIL